MARRLPNNDRAGLDTGFHLHSGGAEQGLVVIDCESSGFQIGFGFHRLSPFAREEGNWHAKPCQEVGRLF